jgi:hypothetical protein
MFVTSSADRAGLLVAVVSGGRPQLRLRPTHRFLDEARAAGVQDVVWLVGDWEAEGYEEDPRNPIVTYSRDWAFEYAREHWTSPATPPTRDGWIGVFPGREAACREAERRGCWGVLQLDDNIVDRYMLRATRGGKSIVNSRGGLAFYIDMLVGVALSTNARMIGAQLASIAKERYRIARPGFPYSCFIEKVGPGREEWYGLFEEDIFHAIQYGDRPDGATSALLPLLRYQKASASQGVGGMRAYYDHDRSRQLQALNPHAVKVGVKRSMSNGRGGARVFHMMPAGAIRNPLVTTDPELYGRVSAALIDCMREWQTAEREGNRIKAQERLASHLRKSGVSGAAGPA